MFFSSSGWFYSTKMEQNQKFFRFTVTSTAAVAPTLTPKSPERVSQVLL